MNTLTLGQIIDELEQRYPQDLAETWDQVGIHFGDRTRSVSKIMTALDIRHNVIDEAIAQQVDTIIVHHPPIFQPIQRFDTSRENIRLYQKIIQHNINVYALHTNLDIAWNGMNDWIAEQLGLTCVESTLPLDEAGNPGIGRIGLLPSPLSREDLLTHVKQVFKLQHLVVMEQTPKAQYQRIAVLGGSGAEYVQDAANAQADAFITGDISYHRGHSCYDANLLTIDVGHYIEAIFIPKMATLLKKLAHESQWDVTVIESQSPTTPFETIIF
ncbi:Nif3-like dinuclear metal center hexameric protein [Aerococcaceae bacterium NML190073]|nr:Nif3-like dinuclear metal center hexameric protein [Aerococcaceae bacterium NML190073]